MTNDSSPTVSPAYLIWEDAGEATWWLARSHDDDVNYVIARDSVTAHLLILIKKSALESYKVVATVPIKSEEVLPRAIAEAKRLCIKWIGDSKAPLIQQSVRRWRIARWMKIGFREGPLAFVSLCIGVVLALIISSFFIATGITGWSMVVVGTIFGTLFGWILKWLADKKLASLLGPIGRFITVTGSVTIGAVLTAFLFMILYGA